MGRMTRAVIELTGDISTAMPRMSGLIEGCAYNREYNLMRVLKKYDFTQIFTYLKVN